MKIIHNRYIPFKGFDAVNLLGILFVRKGLSVDEIILNHEKIHSAQMKELLLVGFYMAYVFEFFFRLLQCLFQDKSSIKEFLYGTEPTGLFPLRRNLMVMRRIWNTSGRGNNMPCGENNLEGPEHLTFIGRL